ncbi:MAG TPA: MgtC/SapB family protein [Tangfeifania sp.]|nr:MgtC/SapB family protein [Tangfeifania sp.]
MEFLKEIIDSNEITWQTATVRLLLSFLVGMLIGFEREANHQPAGLRTHILISIGATVVMLISIFIPQTFTDFVGDPGRIAAQVVSGIGFLGAGAILKFGTDVKGLTTAASIWAMAAIGLAVGAGMYAIGLISAGVVLFALTVMNLFEQYAFRQRTLRKIVIEVKKKNSNPSHLEEIFREFDVRIESTGFERNVSDASEKVIYVVAVTKELNVKDLSDSLEKEPGIVAITVELFH